MDNEYGSMLKGFGLFVVANWEIFLGLVAIFFLMKFVKMSVGVLKTLVILYVFFVIYKYQDYDKIKTQLSSDVTVVSEKIAPIKQTIDNNLTGKIKEEDRAVTSKFYDEMKTMLGGAFSSTDELIQRERERMRDGK